MARSFVILVVALLFALAPSARTQGAWTELATDHFQLFVQGDVSGAREALQRLETTREFMARCGWVAPEPGNPVTILAFDNDDEYNRYKRNPGAFAFYRPVGDLDYILMRRLQGGSERTVLHEYIHSILYRSAPSLPLWMAEGLAEAFSACSEEAGNVVYGRPIPEHLDILQSAHNATIENIFNVKRGGQTYSVPEKAWPFYAASWAAAHVLLTDARYSKNFRRFVASANEKGAETALYDVYGVSIKAFTNDVMKRVQSLDWPVLGEQSAISQISVSMMSQADADVHWALHQLQQ